MSPDRVHCIKIILYSNIIKLESAIVFQRMKFHKFLLSEKGYFHKVPCLHSAHTVQEYNSVRKKEEI